MNERLASRRAFLGLFAAGAGSIALAGCGVANTPAAPAATSASPVAARSSVPSPAPSAVTTSATARPAAAQPISGGSLRAVLIVYLPSIDCQQSLPGINATVGNAYEQLTRY